VAGNRLLRTEELIYSLIFVRLESNDGLCVTAELGRMWKEQYVAHFKVLSKG
jgi:hypothetical protein